MAAQDNERLLETARDYIRRSAYADTERAQAEKDESASK